MILYLHGFRSSPNSFKANLLAVEMQRRGMAQDWSCPQLPASPAQAIALSNDIIEQTSDTGQLNPEHDLVVIGSSLGGYYAAVLAAQWHCRCVLLNPAVHAARDLATQVGTHKQYHSDAPFHFLPEYVDELAAMQPPPPANPRRCLLIAAKGDEVLDWREMVQWVQDGFACAGNAVEAASDAYPGGILLLDGSDHGLSDFAQHMPRVLEFALAPEPRNNAT